MQLADAGYDVWMANNRGTEYSQEHEYLDAEKDDYWNYTYSEYGLYDVTANVKMIKEAAGVDKIFYIGYSLGTAQMFYSLAHLEEEFLADSIYKFIALAPCFASDTPTETSTGLECTTRECVSDKITADEKMGWVNSFGPNWDATLEKICKELDEGTC